MATKEHKRRRRTLTDEQRALLATIRSAEVQRAATWRVLDAHEMISSGASVTAPNHLALLTMGYLDIIYDLHGHNPQWSTTEDANEALNE